MAILHGSWLPGDRPSFASDASESGYLFIWGETWRRLTPLDLNLKEWAATGTLSVTGAQDKRPVPDAYPLAMTQAELMGWLSSSFAQSVGLNGIPQLALPKALGSESDDASESVTESVTEQPPGTKKGPRSIKSAKGEPTSRGKRKTDLSDLSETKQTQDVPQIQENSPRPLQWRDQIVALPTHLGKLSRSSLKICPVSPQASEDFQLSDRSLTEGYLFPWVVRGVCLPPQDALRFLLSLPLGLTGEGDMTWLGGDLRFWCHLARWVLDLLARSKFVPQLDCLDAQTWSAHWHPLLDSGVDQTRFRQFCQQMPRVCRHYAFALNSENPDLQQVGTTPVGPATPLAWEPKSLIVQFLTTAIDWQVRTTAHTLAAKWSAKSPGKGRSPQLDAPANAVQAAEQVYLEWWHTLTTSNGSVCEPESASESTPEFSGEPSHTPKSAMPEALERLKVALNSWITPIAPFLAGEHPPFRTCFHLVPPASGDRIWHLAYLLQAVDDPDCRVDAATVWSHPVECLPIQGRVIDHPQETLLRGLGLAAKLYPVLEPSLESQYPVGCSLPVEQVYEFLKSVAWRLEENGFGVILPPSLARGSSNAGRLGLKVQAASSSLTTGQKRLGLQSLLNFQWHLVIGNHTLSKHAFEHLSNMETPLVEVDGDWVELRPQDVRLVREFFQTRQDSATLSLEDALRMGTGDTPFVGKLPVVSFEASGTLQELVTALTDNRAIASISTPAQFQGELRPYQERGVGWLAFLERWGLGACLADDMGLGKTIQTIAFLLHLREDGALERPVLLVCPTSVLGNWEREVKKFAPTLRVIVHHGDKRTKDMTFVRECRGKDVVITSYPLIYRDSQIFHKMIWQGVILDEAQTIKNPESKQSQAIRKLHTQFRIALTGTPVENRLGELWSIMDFLNPGFLGPRNFFQRRFAIPIERYGDMASLQTLRSLVQPFILRRLKSDRDIIQDLPEKQEISVFCGLTPEQAELYQHTVEQTMADIEAAEGIQRHGLVLALLTKLKQICNHPAQFLKEKSLESAARSGKLQRLQAMLEEILAEGDRTLIFTQFAELGKLLKAYLETHFGREVLFLYGGVKKQQREEMVDRFQQDPQGPPILILSLKAGGVGLNLTRANHVFHFDRWWNPAVENQATDRAFRIGQTRNILVHKFVCSGTLEERIHDMIERKKNLAEQVINAGEDWLTELDTAQLRDLLLLDRAAVIDES